jgi:Tol biopolymer transport system component
MLIKSFTWFFALSLFFNTLSAQSAQACGGEANSYFRVKNITVLKAPGTGGRVDWSHALDLIAYDQKDENGISQIRVMNPDGSGDRCITCKRTEILQVSNGQPAWDPSGRYLIFQMAYGNNPNPGAGVNADLWVYSFSDDKFTQLTFLSNFGVDGQHGVLHPHFSHDGKRLSWSEMYQGINRGAHGELGYWKLMVADFVNADSGISLQNSAQVQTGTVQGFYENHGFLPGDDGLIYSSNYESLPFINKIYRQSFQRTLPTQLTYRGYNEHAEFSPDGSYIAWMNNVDISGKGTDLWGMGPFGGGKERITYFNDSTCPEFIDPYVIVADHSFSADGKKLVVYLQNNVLINIGGEDKSLIVVLEAY